MSRARGLRRTRVVTVDAVAPDASVIAEAATVLRSGGLVAFPTETVYGLGANALDEEAVLGIFEAKDRDRDDPLIVHISDAGKINLVAANLPAVAAQLADRFWPGPLTLVLRRASAIAPAVSGGLETVAVRVPSHPVARALIEAAAVPIAAPSANRFMRTSATTARHVLDDLDGRIDMVLDGGPAAAGIESTVVSVEAAAVRILRKGAVTAEALEAALSGDPAVRLDVEAVADARSGSPGTLTRHYAPRTPLTVINVAGDRGFMILEAMVRDSLASGERPGLLLTAEDAGALAQLSGAIVAELGSALDDTTMAHRLYAAMRDLDASPATTILLARTVPESGMGAAMNDRLRRAATRIVSG